MQRLQGRKRRAIGLLAILLCFHGGALFADGLDAKTAEGLQAVIEKQMAAFSRGDGAAAEAFAAPAIRTRFPSPTQFLDMVRTHYGALVKPQSTQFQAVEMSPQGPLQKVTVVAADGTVWSAIYSFTQVDGEWRITGCALTKDDSQQAI